MHTVHFSLSPRLAWVAVLALASGACSSSSDIGSATGGTSGATGVAGTLQASGGATGGTTDRGSGGDMTAMGGSGVAGSGVAGASSDTGGAGATGTGGTSDASGAGGGGQSNAGGAGMSNGGTNGSGCGTAAFCDDFERSTMLGTEWMLDNSVAANTIEVDSTQHHSGMNAVHIKYGTGAMATYIDASKGFPFPNDTFWGRVWMYAMTGPETGHHVFIETRNGPQTDMSGVRELNTQTPSILATNMQAGDKSGKSSVPLPQGKWACFEWHVTSAGGTGTVDLYMDGTKVMGTGLTGVKIQHLMKQRIGIQRYSGGTAGELWYDDYAVGTAQIGCN